MMSIKEIFKYNENNLDLELKKYKDQDYENINDKRYMLIYFLGNNLDKNDLYFINKHKNLKSEELKQYLIDYDQLNNQIINTDHGKLLINWGIDKFSDILYYCKNLEALDISNVNLRGYKIKNILESMKNINIKYLYLEKSNLNDDDCFEISDFLKNDKTLELLFLQNNFIKITSVIYLFNILKNNKTLSYLDLSFNYLPINPFLISNDALIEALIELLEVNNTITKLITTGTNLDLSSIEEWMYNKLKENKKYQEQRLKENEELKFLLPLVYSQTENTKTGIKQDLENFLSKLK